MLLRRCAACPPSGAPRATAHHSVRFVSILASAFCPPYDSAQAERALRIASHFEPHLSDRFRPLRIVGRAKPPARHFDVAQVLRGVPAVSRSAGNGASFSAFRQRTRVRLLPALRFRSSGTCFAHRLTLRATSV